MGFKREVFLLDDRMRINTKYKPVRNSLYAIHLSRWLEHFPLEQFLILDGDRFIRDPLFEVSFMLIIKDNETTGTI